MAGAPARGRSRETLSGETPPTVIRDFYWRQFQLYQCLLELVYVVLILYVQYSIAQPSFHLRPLFFLDRTLPLAPRIHRTVMDEGSFLISFRPL